MLVGLYSKMKDLTGQAPWYLEDRTSEGALVRFQTNKGTEQAPRYRPPDGNDRCLIDGRDLTGEIVPLGVANLDEWEQLAREYIDDLYPPLTQSGSEAPL